VGVLLDSFIRIARRPLYYLQSVFVLILPLSLQKETSFSTPRYCMRDQFLAQLSGCTCQKEAVVTVLEVPMFQRLFRGG
jgi:hypothetical protein